MPYYSDSSMEQLETCHPLLQRVFFEVIKHFDCTIIEGARTEEKQRENVEKGVSQTMDSKHIPGEDGWSHAVDAIPYPIDWGDRERMTFFAGQVIGTAIQMGIRIRWGGDWDQDTEVKDNKFDDLVHFELVGG